MSQTNRGQQRRMFSFAALALAALTADACAANRTIVHQPSSRSTVSSCPVFVMEPFMHPGAFQGNIGRDAFEVQRIVAERILEAVREPCPDADIARTRDMTSVTPIRGYAAAAPLTPGEDVAAAVAFERGARNLLVPTILLWKEVRTDDPVGALFSPHNGVDIELRLMRLDVPGVKGRVTFRNRSRVTLNQPAERLLNGRFHAAVRQLLSGGGQGHVSARARQIRGQACSPRWNRSGR